jgi:hypothetical protein
MSVLSKLSNAIFKLKNKRKKKNHIFLDYHVHYIIYCQVSFEDLAIVHVIIYIYITKILP